MAHYLFLTDPSAVEHVEAKTTKGAVDKLKLKDGDERLVYRVAGPARKVKIKTETLRRVVVE